MERNETKSPDHIVYVVASLIILVLLAYFASRSVIVTHKIELPILRFQAGLFSYVFPGPDYEIESYRIQKINNVLDSEFVKKKDYSTIKADILRKAVMASSVHTRNCARVLASLVLGFFGMVIIVKTMRVRHRLYEKRENVSAFQGNGVEGFVQLIGKHVEPGIIELVNRSPTPRHLEQAFRAARENVNIPCSAAARLFPRGTRERMALLEYGKANVRFAEDPEDKCNAKRG